jgi:predicted site-specific integrase-resolvase
MDKTDLIGSREAADLLGVNRTTFNRWCVSGKVPIHFTAPSKVGARLFRRADIQALAQKRAA